MNIGRAIDPAVAEVPERTALIVGDRRCSYRELEQWVRRVAAALAARGLGPGARVALVDNAGILSVATILAAARIGACSAQMNVLLTTDELSKLATTVDAGIGVAGEPFRTNLAGALGAEAVLGEDEVAGRGEDEADATDGIAIAVADTDDALVLFTSGTTGLPSPSPSATEWSPSVWASTPRPSTPTPRRWST